MRRVVQNPHCHRPGRLRLAPHLAYIERLFPADHFTTAATGRVSSLSDLRSAVRCPALNEPACVARPLLVDCNGLRVRDDWPHLLHLDAAKQVEAENQRGRHDAPSAKVGAAPLEAPPSGHLAELQHVSVRQSKPEREQQTDQRLKWRAAYGYAQQPCVASGSLRSRNCLVVCKLYHSGENV